jgi:hypothetical protein
LRPRGAGGALQPAGRAQRVTAGAALLFLARLPTDVRLLFAIINNSHGLLFAIINNSHGLFFAIINNSHGRSINVHSPTFTFSR